MSHATLNAIGLDPETGAAAPDTVTARLLRAAHTCAEPRHLDLYREILRRNGPKEWDTSELIALSAKLSLGKLHRNRYDSAVEWTAAGAKSFYTGVVNAAPTDAVAALLQRPGNYVAEWIRSAGRAFSYLAVEYDSRVYKIYLFDPVIPSFLEEQALEPLLPRLHRSAYIDCIEINLDQPERYTRPVYFKLRAPTLSAALDPGYRPHPRIENRVLRQIGDRERVVAALRSITAGLRRVNDPVIKLRYLPGAGGSGEAVRRLGEADYGISINTSDPARLKRLNDHRAEVLAIADALACREAVEAWLDAIRPFDCFISYICVGDDFVTFYYKSTPFLKKQPAALGLYRHLSIHRPHPGL